MSEQQTQLVSGAPVPEDRSHTAINERTGLQRDYVVLTPEERAKGFVKPVRDAYRHVGRRPKYPLRDLTPEEAERDRHHGYVKFEAYPESEAPVTGRYWTEADLKSGCGRVTTMHRSIAETYARDPNFYSGTFCSTCGAHFHLEQFAWEPDGEPMYVPDQAPWHAAQATKPAPVVLPTLRHTYDPFRDVLTVEGVKYAGGLFRDLGSLGAVGDSFQIMKREDGTVWLRSISSPEERGPNEARSAEETPGKAG